MKAILFVSLLLSSLNFGHAKQPLVIGSKNFSESIIIAQMLAILLEERFDVPVIRKFGLGGTKIAFDALVNDAIHVYPDYTGTGYSMILKMSGEKAPTKVHQVVSQEFKQRWGISWSHSLGFDNTYALVVRSDDERFKGIHKISQLSGKVSSFIYAGAYEFMERKDGHDGFSKTYSLDFAPKNVIAMGAGLMYSAIRDEEVDMIVAYSTDGRIQAYDLKKLEDDLNYFPPYQASILAKEKTLAQFPKFKEAIGLLEGLISEEEMIQMNDKVDRLKQESFTVARNFLINKRLLLGKINTAKAEIGFINFIKLKKDYLFKIITEHLILTFSALALAILISLPVGIGLTRYQHLAKFVFPIVNTIQTIPSLALLGFLIPFMGIGFTPALVALFLYSLLPLIRNTYTGIQGVDRTYIEVSKGIGLTNFQILIHVEIPMAMPVILAGLRTAVVIVIGTATLAALIGAGGLGDPIFRGVSTVNSNLILLGAIPAALLAIIADKIIGISERFLVSKGIRPK